MRTRLATLPNGRDAKREPLAGTGVDAVAAPAAACLLEQPSRLPGSVAIDLPIRLVEGTVSRENGAVDRLDTLVRTRELAGRTCKRDAVDSIGERPPDEWRLEGWVATLADLDVEVLPVPAPTG